MMVKWLYRRADRLHERAERYAAAASRLGGLWYRVRHPFRKRPHFDPLLSGISEAYLRAGLGDIARRVFPTVRAGDTMYVYPKHEWDRPDATPLADVREAMGLCPDGIPWFVHTDPELRRCSGHDVDTASIDGVD